VPKNNLAKSRYYAVEIGDAVVSFTAPEDGAIKMANHFQAWYNKKHNSNLCTENFYQYAPAIGPKR